LHSQCIVAQVVAVQVTNSMRSGCDGKPSVAFGLVTAAEVIESPHVAAQMLVVQAGYSVLSECMHGLHSVRCRNNLPVYIITSLGLSHVLTALQHSGLKI
jgi:hypothetical protein